MNKDSFFVVQRWMLDYGIKGNDLMVYAIIYGYSQNGDGCFHGGLDNLCEWTNSTKQGLMKNLTKLEEMKLITKKEIYVGSCKYCEYKALRPLNKVINEENAVKQSLIVPLNKVTQPLNKVTDTVKQSLPNNIRNNINNNIYDNIDDSKIDTPFNSDFDDFKNPLEEEKKERMMDKTKKIFDKWISNSLPCKDLSNFVLYAYPSFCRNTTKLQLTEEDILKAIDNYVLALKENNPYLQRMTFDKFAYKVNSFLDGNFVLENYKMITPKTGGKTSAVTRFGCDVVDTANEEFWRGL